MSEGEDWHKAQLGGPCWCGGTLVIVVKIKSWEYNSGFSHVYDLYGGKIQICCVRCGFQDVVRFDGVTDALVPDFMWNFARRRLAWFRTQFAPFTTTVPPGLCPICRKPLEVIDPVVLCPTGYPCMFVQSEPATWSDVYWFWLTRFQAGCPVRTLPWEYGDGNTYSSSWEKLS